MTQNTFLKLLKKPTKDRPLLELTMTVGELAADTATKGDLLEAVPFVSLAFKALKAKDSISDAMFANKLVLFINGIGELSDDERGRPREKFLQDGGKKAGETLLLVLDRVTDLDKPELLAFLFKQFVNELISSEQLRRLCVAVDVGFADDLRDLLTPEAGRSEQEKQDCRRRLMPTGLTAIHIGNRYDDLAESSYHYTELGALLFRLVNGYPPLDSIPSDGRRVAG
jgi:hypothetical protein